MYQVWRVQPRLKLHSSHVTEEEAKEAWKEVSWKHVDEANVEYRIMKHGEAKW